ncbi:MAG: hypothetical protein F9K40_04960 [Kofleriaceae bacterium]|nr:MAG: hypothetical protein F9K40_04960 [Kofleriaceae bacterium]MBZ0238201.1 hypothetical protein [Kofleriaceae bacterium]
MFPRGVATVAIVAAALASAAHADEPRRGPQVVIVPAECTVYWTMIPDAAASPAAWDRALSFAACIQDRSVYAVEDVDQLEEMVLALQDALIPSLQYYVTAIELAPGPTKLRAAYAIGSSQVALMTRARMSIVAPELRPPLEALLVEHARVAHLVFSTIEAAADGDPALAPDAATRAMVRSSRQTAAALRSFGERAQDRR